MIQPNEALYENKPLDTYLSTASLERPTALHSILNQFTKGIVSTVALGADAESVLLGSRTDGSKMWHSAIDLLDAEQANVTSYSARGAGFVSNLLGQTLSLAPLAGAAVAGEVGEVGLGALAKLAPKPIGFALPKVAATGQFLAKSARYGATFAGFAAPEAIEESYDENTNAFNWRKASIEIGANGALGALIPSAQFLLGLLGKKLGIGLVKELAEGKPVDVSSLPKEQAEWVKDHAEDPNSLETHQKATEILSKEGYKVDTNNHKVNIDLLTANDGANLNKVVTDPLFADVPEDLKTTTKNYILNNRLDELRADKSIADGLDGWISHIDREIGKKDIHLAEAEKGMLEGIKDNMEFSQAGMMRHLEKIQFENSHLAHLPYTVPENVLKNIELETQIRKLEAKLKAEKPELSTYYRGYKTTPEHAIVDDAWLGKGYWMAESKSYAELYGKNLEEIKGKYNLYDLNHGTDEELNKLFNQVKHIVKTTGNIATRKEAKESLRNVAHKKGYVGFRLKKPSQVTEIMFFEKPKSYAENKQTRRRITELEGKKPKILTPKEEIEAIHAKSGEKGFGHSKEYHRLTELASYWPQARKLLDRVHLEQAHNAQVAYRNVLDAFSKIIKGNLSPLAEPARASEYLKTRLEQHAGDVTKTEPTKLTEPAKPKEPGTADDAIVERSSSEEIKDNYSKVKRKSEQFKKNGEALKNLINCVLGTRNGQV